MALLHRATLSPTKAELLSGWLPAQPWGPGPEGAVEIGASFRFDDPVGSVGLEVLLVRSAGLLLQVPVTYRDAPLTDAADHLIGTLQHSVLGERWVYDGLGDPVFVSMLAASTLTGCGQAVGVVEIEGRMSVLPPLVRLAGGGWSSGPAPIDGFSPLPADGHWAVLQNDRFVLRVARRPIAGDRPPIGLTALLPTEDDPFVLAEISARPTT